jgi:UDP-N-acetylglucosamine transferase subunit ALG13
MIFVTVGTHTQPFDRLLQKVDELVKKRKIKEKIIAQIGYSTYKPKNYEYFTFTSEEKILELNKRARLIITHAGAGSIITALQFRKPIIVVPRLKKFNEHVNDHQVQIAKAFEKEKKVLACYDIEDLEKVIIKAKKFRPRIKKEKPKIFSIIKNFLEELEYGRSSLGCKRRNN